MSWFGKLALKLDGWKTVLGYILAQLPWLSAHPMLVDAIIRVMANPSPATAEGAKAWADLAIQILLLLGVTGIAIKNVKYGTRRVGQAR